MRENQVTRKVRTMKVPKQQRALETRAALMEAGRIAFAAKGLEGANLTSDILEPAGVSAGSFYHQFNDKTDLLIALLDAAAERRQQTIALTELFDADLSLEEVLGHTLRGFLSSLDESGHDWVMQVRAWSSDDERIRDRISAGRDAWRESASRLLGDYANDKSQLAEATDVVVIFLLGLISRYLELEPEERIRAREELPERGAAFLARGASPLLGIS